MLILAILSVASWLIDFIFGIIFGLLPIADVPESVTDYSTKFFDILGRGVDMFGFLIGPIGKILLSIVISLEAFHTVYKIIWFVIRKVKFSE